MSRTSTFDAAKTQDRLNKQFTCPAPQSLTVNISNLTLLDGTVSAPSRVLPDSCFWGHAANKVLPKVAKDFIRSGCDVISTSEIVGELTANLGLLEPDRPNSGWITEKWLRIIHALRKFGIHHREASFEDAVGFMSGRVWLCWDPKSKGYKKDSIYNDVSIYLHAMETGAAIVTGNPGDFDIIRQVWPGVDVFYYKPKNHPNDPD